MKKLQHYFPAILALAFLATSSNAEELPKVTGDAPPPVIKLPVETPRNVANYDPLAVKLRAAPWHVTAVKAPESWAKNPAAKGRGIRVAVLDTGVQADHPGLHGMVKGTYNAITKSAGAADGHGHGTHCAGIVHSIAPDAEIYAIKVLGDDGSGAVDVIAHGIDYATTVFKVDVISMSLGGPTSDPYMPPAIKRAIAAGIVVVCAAGNDGGPADTEGYPGRYTDSISVAASDQNGRLATFSSWGPNVFTVDPGVDILSTLPGSKEGTMSGTSMATPCEAGKVASWIASNGIAKDANRRDGYRKAALGASPFKERANSRGFGLYTLDKITGSVATPTPGPAPTPQPITVTISLSDLSADAQARLRAAGVNSLSLTLGTGATAPAAPESIPVQSVPVPGVWTTPGVQPWFPPLPESVPQTMPSRCPGGVCPTPQAEVWQPFGGRFRPFR